MQLFLLLLGRFLRHLNLFFQPERRRLSTFLSTTDYRIIMNQGDRKSFLPLGHFNSKSSLVPLQTAKQLEDVSQDGVRGRRRASELRAPTVQLFSKIP